MILTLVVDVSDSNGILAVADFIKQTGAEVVEELHNKNSDECIDDCESGNNKYPFPEMKLNDWFKIPEGTMIKSVRVAASYWNAKYNGERHFKVYSQQRAVRRVK